MASPEDTMILDTTKGKVVIAMRPDLAPGHVARIKELVREGFVVLPWQRVVARTPIVLRSMVRQS